MPIELFNAYANLPVFGLIAARLGGTLMFVPGIASAAVPANVRVLLVLALSLLLVPTVALPSAAPATILELLLALACEFLLGMAVGLVASACFVGLQTGALLIAQEAGIAFGQIVDPSSEEHETVVGVFYVQLGIAIFLVVGGHRALVSSVLDTFESLPLLSVTLAPERVVDALCGSLTLGCSMALRVAGPALLAMLLVNVALGFISRTMPQLNILAVGFSVKSLVAFVVMAVALPAAATGFLDVLEQTFEWVSGLLGH